MWFFLLLINENDTILLRFQDLFNNDRPIYIKSRFLIKCLVHIIIIIIIIKPLTTITNCAEEDTSSNKYDAVDACTVMCHGYMYNDLYMRFVKVQVKF